MSKTKTKLLSLVLVFFVAFAAMWTINIDTTYAATKKIHLKKTTVTVLAGKTYQQKLIDKKGKTIKATKVKWKSLKTSVAKISKKGKITAVKAGTAKMTAKYKGKTYKFTVKVKGHNNSLKVEPADVSVAIGQTVTVIVKTDKGESVSYSVNNDKVDCEWGDWIDDTNDSYFYIEGVKKGSSIITIYDTNNKSLKTTIRVTITDPKNASISVEPSTASLKVGETQTFIVKTDAGEAITCDQNNDNVSCEWGDWIDDTNDSYFYVTGEKPGDSVITIYDDVDNSVKATIKVTVKDIEPAEAMQRIKDFVEANGVQTTNGAEYSYKIDSENSITIQAFESSLRFSYIYNSGTNNTVMTSMILNMPECSATTVGTTVFAGKISYAILNADVDMAAYNPDTTNLTFEKESGDIANDANLQTLCNTNFQLGMEFWDALLQGTVSLSMKNVGFSNF